MFSSNEGQPSLVHADSTPSSRICLPAYTHTKYKLSTSAQHTLTTSKYGADRQRVKKHTILQVMGFEPTSNATQAESDAFRPLGRWHK